MANNDVPSRPDSRDEQALAVSEIVHFVARQPIFDRSEHVIGYELLFRSGPEGDFEHDDPSAATAHVIDDIVNVVTMGDLLGGAKAFVNVTEENLLSGQCRLLPAESTVLELSADIEPDDQLRQACLSLKHDGYTIAIHNVLNLNDLFGI